jgi:hypothetical protein
MDTAAIRTRIEDIWEQLPSVFTTRDVLQLIRATKEAGATVRAILNGMVGEGRLYHSFKPTVGSGRKPTAWSKDRSAVREEVILELVRAALPRLPSRFSMEDLLMAVGMSRRMFTQVRGALDRLADAGVVLGVGADHHFGSGHPKYHHWTADTHLMVEELAAAARRALAPKDEPSFRGWNPSDFDDPIARLGIPDPTSKSG